ncbi:GAF and ANTAR domain-containing protein [Williamsia soli]|uniref:GAF and ANTAR domain-containing protein n=1 Tax=Williamsia soli TaxID=364929 RepID=UPI0027DDF4AB|nr:GAF and ANTAR domain-containing protein [Williamsia soli]
MKGDDVIEGSNEGIHLIIANLVRDMHDSLRNSDLDAILASITAGAVDYVDGAQYAGIILVDKRKMTTESVAVTDPIVELLDAIQTRVGEGPCLEAAWEHQTVRLNDFAEEPRWPAFVAETLARTSVLSSLSFELHSNDNTLGALNLFSEHANAFSAEAEEVGRVYATHAALVMQRAREKEHFNSALASRDVIGQAKGIIMERFDIDSIAAFELMRRLSQDTNTPVVELSRQLVRREDQPDKK